MVPHRLCRLVRRVPLLLAAVALLLTPGPGLWAQAFNGGPRASGIGAWSPVVDWPLIAIHASVLPDGRVMTYGTDERGMQSGETIYDIWTPTQGTGAGSHETLENTTPTDIFCNAQLLIPRTNQLLMAGGDVTIDGERNFSADTYNFFDWDATNMVAGPGKLTGGRWYATLTHLSNGDILLHGGRDEKGTRRPGNTTPEVYNRNTGWRTLTGATSDAAYGSDWYYPWTFLTPRGSVFFTSPSGAMWEMDSIWNGGKGRLLRRGYLGGDPRVAASAARIDDNRILISGGATSGNLGGANAGKARRGSVVVELSTRPGSNDFRIASRPTMLLPRTEHNSTNLPNGTILITGGSAERNNLAGVAYQAELYSPGSDRFFGLAEASMARLYHSTALLLPDATVLTAGGGAPGPQKNLNAEIYYPPYLFKKGRSGELAERPRIRSTNRLRYGRPFNIRVDRDASEIGRVAFMSLGSVTHAFDMGQRRVLLPVIRRSNDVITVQGPRAGRYMPPGYYMVFVIDRAGVPSVAKIVEL